MLNILRVIDSVNPAAGGPINGLLSSTKELVKMGHNVEVITLDDPEASWINEFKFPVVSFKSYLGTFSYSRLFYKWLATNVDKYDVIIIHGIWQFHSYAAAKSCKDKGVPYVIFTHGMLDPWFNLNNKIKTLKKNVYWKLFGQYAINNANSVLFTSEEEKTLARHSFTPYSPIERVVAYGSPESTFDAEKAVKNFYSLWPELKYKKFALFLSRIDKKKGIDLLVEAIGAIKGLPKDFLFVIAGPDNKNYKAEIVKLSHKFGVSDRILWVGMLQKEVKWGAFYASDVFILPSHQENFGIVVAEALSTATPVLITNKVNIWREIKSAGAGIVVNDDVQGIESLLDKWFALTETEKQLMSEKAESCYSNNFSIESAASDLESVLNSVVKVS
jgi:glycosyltransferase involved in cell wall biosynthesis